LSTIYGVSNPVYSHIPHPDHDVPDDDAHGESSTDLTRHTTPGHLPRVPKLDDYTRKITRSS
jgi:hypothetical protein